MKGEERSRPVVDGYWIPEIMHRRNAQRGGSCSQPQFHDDPAP